MRTFGLVTASEDCDGDGFRLKFRASEFGFDDEGSGNELEIMIHL